MPRKTHGDAVEAIGDGEGGGAISTTGLKADYG